MSPDDRDRRSPAFDKPKNYDEMVAAARKATEAAIDAGADYETVKRSALNAALVVAGLRPLDDPWARRMDPL